MSYDISRKHKTLQRACGSLNSDELKDGESPLPAGEGRVRETPSLHVHLPLPIRQKNNARSLRTKGTDAEARLWYHLRGRNTAGFKFRRQHPFGPYILDFYCEYAKLAVEVDGAQHLDSTNALRDHARTSYLESQGIRVLRFNNVEVLQQTDAVMSVILEALESPHPSPLPRGEGTRS